MTGGSWTHLVARRAVRPLLGTGVTPNHLTTLRLVTGLVACVAVALGSRAGLWWGGALWLTSAFLDRADGELARIGNMRSTGGHRYDYYSDGVVSAVFFVAIGIGLRHDWLGGWAIVLGVLAGGSLALVNWWSEWLEQLAPPGTRVLCGRWGFDPDDAFYLLAAFTWLRWLAPTLLAAAIVVPPIAAVIGIRLMRLNREVLRPAGKIQDNGLIS